MVDQAVTRLGILEVGRYSQRRAAEASISSIVSAIVPGSAEAAPARSDSDCSYERAVTTTVAPSAASRWAIARPMPRLLPVTKAVLPDE